MAKSKPSQQFSFRLPRELVTKLTACEKAIRARGLDVTRADVVRLLLQHALETTHCDLTQILSPGGDRLHPA